MAIKILRQALKSESAPGMVLVVATIAALIVSNSPLSSLYNKLLELPLVVALGDFALNKPLLLWINDGLMAIFFLLIGLEVKREIQKGELSSKDQLILPAIAALGGFVIPALIYIFINYSDPDAVGGWAIPAATDIAFALGVLMLLGSRVPLALKVFLTSIAVFDDIAAIVVIAAFYTQDLSLLSLILGILGMAILVLLNRLGVYKLGPYILVGIFVWICVLKSGVHATLAGFALGLIIPASSKKPQPEGEHSIAYELEHSLHPWVMFGIMPVFAFANAGISFQGLSSEIMFSPVTIGITLGLLIGKQAGIFLCAWGLIKLGFARLPKGTNWRGIYGVSLLAGIGFTMSLFIGTLAFEHGNFEHMVATRLGVLLGSTLSAVAGYMILRNALKPKPAEHQITEVQPV